jgi:hypothetical protein
LREIDGQSKGLPTFPQVQTDQPQQPLTSLLPDPSKVPERTE